MKMETSLWALCAVLCFSVSCAHAQETESSVMLPVVLVTANKQEEDPQKIPQSVTAITARQVDDARVTSVDKLGLRVPNLSFSTGGMGMINLTSMRGVRSDPHSNTPAVTMYIDDVPVTTNAGYIAQLFDVESVEVLRGPQGTLYGRNAEGGVIKVTTKKPDRETTGRLSLTGGSKELGRTTGALSGEMVEDTLFAGLAMQYFTQQGWVENDSGANPVDDKKEYSGRGRLRYTPTDDLEVNFAYGMVKYDEGSFGMYNLQSMSEERHTDSNDPGRNRSAFNDQSLTVGYDLSSLWKLTSVTTRKESDLNYTMDYDFSTMPMYEVHKYDRYMDIGQEVRLNYEQDGVSGVFGLTYNRNDKKIRYTYYNMGTKHHATDKTNQYAAFGQLKVPFWDKWAVTAGARLDYYDSKFQEEETGYSASGSWNSFSPKLALEYAVTDDNLVYVSGSRGFRAAGFDAYQGSPGKYEFDEEELWAVEVGSKNTLWDGKARLNAALFYHKFKNMQLESYYTTVFSPMPSIENVGDPQGLGGEVELTVMPLAGLELFGSVGYTHMRFDDFTDATGDHSGNSIPYVPEWTCSLGTQYRHGSGFFARAEILGASRTYLDSRNDGNIPAYATVNTKIGWEFGNLDVYLFADNVFDERHDYVNAFGGTYGVATPGRVVGTTVCYHF